MFINKVKTAILKFITEKNYSPGDAAYLRGFIGNLYRDEDLFHNHEQGNRFLYRMPLVQYRVMDRYLSMIAYNGGIAALVQHVANIRYLKIGDEVVHNFEVRLDIRDEDFHLSEKRFTYCFIRPWLCVNQKNHAAHIDGSLDLNRVLRNNILTNFKGLGITVSDTIEVEGTFSEQKVKVKNNLFAGLIGYFSCNVRIPDYMAFGQRRSIGFGSVRCVGEA